jgi:2-oxoglutarate dehydrogenase E1 component
MLRNPAASSPVADFSTGRFQTVIPDRGDGAAARVLFCSGKIGQELEAQRKNLKENPPAIVLVEQLYPFPEGELAAEMDRHASAKEFVWVQEEPANMGARDFVIPQLQRLARDRAVLSVNRSASASPSTGSAKAHEMEQKTLLSLALGT